MTANTETIAAFAQLKRSFELLFGKAIEADTPAILELKKFCRANQTCGVAPPGQPVDVHRTMILIGRNEVWLRIVNFLTLPPEELADLYGAVAPTKDTDNG